MPTNASSRPASGAEQTRLALIHAGLILFGKQGFEATSTRELAAMAKANIGSIAYHFGGKEGLHAACAQHIVETMRTLAAPVMNDLPEPGSLTPTAAAATLSTVIDRMIGFIVGRPEAGEIVTFVLRELGRPTAALNTIYAGVFEPVHRRLCEIWAAATGEEAESERTRLTVFTLIGQAVYFRIGREAVLRRMGWSTVGAAETAAILDVVRGNVDAILQSRRGPKP